MQGPISSKADKLKLAAKWQNLNTWLDSFVTQSEQFVNNDTMDALQKLYNLPLVPIPASCAPDYETDSAAEDDTNPFIVCLPLALVHTTEMGPLLLPSTFGFSQITVLGFGSLAEKELQLWEVQANDELQGVRMALGEKSFLFRKDLCLAQSKLKKGRAWGKVHKVSWWVQAHH
jgi:hypothetical protein